MLASKSADPSCTLIVLMDGATGPQTALRFVPSETRRAYPEALRRHMLEHGSPLACYFDRNGIFRVDAKDAAGVDGKTEFDKVYGRLKIAPIHALIPQAKVKEQ